MHFSSALYVLPLAMLLARVSPVQAGLGLTETDWKTLSQFCGEQKFDKSDDAAANAYVNACIDRLTDGNEKCGEKKPDVSDSDYFNSCFNQIIENLLQKSLLTAKDTSGTSTTTSSSTPTPVPRSMVVGSTILISEADKKIVFTNSENELKRRAGKVISNHLDRKINEGEMKNLLKIHVKFVQENMKPALSADKVSSIVLNTFLDIKKWRTKKNDEKKAKDKLLKQIDELKTKVEELKKVQNCTTSSNGGINGNGDKNDGKGNGDNNGGNGNGGNNGGKFGGNGYKWAPKRWSFWH